ncbi:hypothetical protein ACHJH3_08530 [Campylobacter sp. MOP7]|uniref:hypothetical protein n=1 Tax=Campylobacter canis TaxID=3378588 RepID=UPI00387E3963
MNEIQKIAFEMFLDSACYENDFKPISEEALAEKLKERGLKASSSSINRWKAKFNWNEAIKNKVTLAMSENKDVVALITRSSLESVVKNTKVDIERNNVLIAASYEALEIEALEILEKKKRGEKLTKEQADMLKFISTLSTMRHDKMLDRQAMMPPEAVSANEILQRFNQIEIEVEDDVVEAEISSDDN